MFSSSFITSMKTFSSLLCIILLLLPSMLAVDLHKFDAIVAKDKSGDFTRISDAIDAAPNLRSSTTRYYIRIKSGMYQEHVEVPPNKSYIAIIGDGAATTKITNNRNEPGHTILDSGTLIVYGNGFMAWNITIENPASVLRGRAMALRNAASHTSFYNCVILGYQDTLFADTGVQFYKNCDIYGSIDFIFGAAKAVFQDCGMFARYIGVGWFTAQGKATATQTSGFVFQNCKVTVDPELDKLRSQVKFYLGRPWKSYAAVMFMESFLDDVIQPAGWDNWENRTELVSLAEYKNYGPGANTSQRVRWHGVHIFSKPYQARPYTVPEYINGSAWLPETGIPFRSGLKNYVNGL